MSRPASSTPVRHGPSYRDPACTALCCVINTAPSGPTKIDANGCTPAARAFTNSAIANRNSATWSNASPAIAVLLFWPIFPAESPRCATLSSKVSHVFRGNIKQVFWDLPDSSPQHPNHRCRGFGITSCNILISFAFIPKSSRHNSPASPDATLATLQPSGLTCPSPNAQKPGIFCQPESLQPCRPPCRFQPKPSLFPG